MGESEHAPCFVYHLLSILRDELKSHTGGAATPIIKKTASPNIQVQVPLLPVQQRSAHVLSACGSRLGSTHAQGAEAIRSHRPLRFKPVVPTSAHS